MINNLLENNIGNILRSLLPDKQLDRIVKSTPKRVTESLKYFTKGYNEKIEEIIGDALFESTSSEMIIIKDIEFYSMCEHHLLPFFGDCHVAYIPNGKIIGLSKIPRIIEIYSRRLQLQENLTSEIAYSLMKSINALGVAVIIEAKHFCMMMRGAKTQNSKTITRSTTGIFKTNKILFKEFCSMLKID